MQYLFENYHKMFVRNGLKWLIEENPTIAMDHVISVIKPQNLHNSVTGDLPFAKYELRKDFNCFLKHIIRLAEAFKIVDSGPAPHGAPKTRTTTNTTPITVAGVEKA